MDAAGQERVGRIVAELGRAELDGLLCTLPENVLMATGYWPVVGTAVAVATRDAVVVLAPEDERELAQRGWAAVRTYRPGSLQRLVGPADTLPEPLGELLTDLAVEDGRLGFDDGDTFEGSSYAAMYRYRGTLVHDLHASAPGATLLSAAESISRLRSVLTPYEVDRVRLGCAIAGAIFVRAAREIRPDLRESEVAAAFRAPLEVDGLARQDVARAGGWVWCMSGPNAARAGAAYARTGKRELHAGDLVLIHCNSYVDGYWTDITRTYVLGEPSDRQRVMYEAIFAARSAALATIQPGVRAAEVDAAARQVLTDHGFGRYFTHGIGHNVGFSVISGEYPPRLHPASSDRLEVGMTFNIEPSIYMEGYGGIRHCDVVTLRQDGPGMLTPFQADLESLTISLEAR